MLDRACVMLQEVAVVPALPVVAAEPVVVMAVVVAVAVAAGVLVEMEGEERPEGHPGGYFGFVRSVAIEALGSMMADATRFVVSIACRGSLRLPRRVRVFAMLGG